MECGCSILPLISTTGPNPNMHPVFKVRTWQTPSLVLTPKSMLVFWSLHEGCAFWVLWLTENSAAFHRSRLHLSHVPSLDFPKLHVFKLEIIFCSFACPRSWHSSSSSSQNYTGLHHSLNRALRSFETKDSIEKGTVVCKYNPQSRLFVTKLHDYLPDS